MSPVEDHNLREFNHSVSADSEPTKLLDHPKQKSGPGGGGSNRFTPAAKSLYRSIFLDDDSLLCCLYSLLFHEFKARHGVYIVNWSFSLVPGFRVTLMPIFTLCKRNSALHNRQYPYLSTFESCPVM